MYCRSPVEGEICELEWLKKLRKKGTWAKIEYIGKNFLARRFYEAKIMWRNQQDMFG